MINGLPVLAAPAEIDVTSVGHLRADLLHLFNLGHRVVVVDMSHTQFCDSTGLHTLLGVHKRVQADGGELRLVIPEDGAVPRGLILTGIGEVIPCFAGLPEALAYTPAGA
jgi:anti-sigma B factor antagonist